MLTHCGHRAAAPPAHPVGRQGGRSRVSRPSGCRAHRAGTSRGGSRALRKLRGRHSASNPAPESPSCHPDPLFTPLERRYNGYGRPARPQKRLLWARAPVAAVRVAFSERWRRRRRPPGRPRAGRRRGARTCHVLVRAAPGGLSGCGGVGRPGELRSGARSVGPGSGAVPGCTEAREGVGRVPPCRSCALICENACTLMCENMRADTYWCEYVGVVV